MKSLLLTFMFSLLTNAQEIMVTKTGSVGEKSTFQLEFKPGKAKIVAMEWNFVSGDVRSVAIGPVAMGANKQVVFDPANPVKCFLFGLNSVVIGEGVVAFVTVAGAILKIGDMVGVTVDGDEAYIQVTNSPEPEPPPPADPPPPEQ
ncbi:MAG: hypothetical protein WC794_05215 [Candidatus Doudnabacteria bacterium]|jgi:hypothetical protein